MIVECSHCQTKFNLPDDKIKPGGVKIRCTRCKNVFDVSPASAAPQPDDSFSMGLDDDLAGFDEGASDLSSGGGDSDVPGDLDGDFGGDDINLDTGDSDFSLDSDLDIGSDGDKSAESDSLEFDLDDTQDTPAGPDRTAGPQETRAGAQSDFTLEKALDGDLDDLDLSFDDAPAPAGKQTPPDTGSDFDLSLGSGSTAPDMDFAPAAAARPASGNVIPDDFGIGDGSLSGGGGDLGFGDSMGIDSGPDVFGDIEEPTPAPQVKKKKAGRRSPLTVALLILVFLLAAGYWAYSTYFSQGVDPDKILSLFSSTEDPLANLENAEMKMHYYYVVNRDLGKILVLEGTVINHSTVGKGRIKVRLTLHDKSGKEIGNTESYCGNVLELSELETLPRADITKLLSVESGKKFNNAHIKANESIPYMLVVFSVPEQTEGFVVSVVGAQNVGE